MTTHFGALASNRFLYSAKDWTANSSRHRQGVSVILRTRDRTVFLERAIKSIAGQTYKDISLCVINDGGEIEPVENITRALLPKNIEVEFIHLKDSIGQVSALNVGFEKVQRQYFAVHDDDDSWAPDFLAEMVGFLERAENKIFIGAVCFATIVEEKLEKNGFVTLNMRPSHRYDSVLSLFESLHLFSQPPPISILMRTESLVVVPQNNLAMAVMYDCEWMTRVLLNADVAVLPKELAFYHHRIADDETLGSARNSVFEYNGEFRRLRTLLQNEQLRSELSHGKIGIGFLSSLIHVLHEKVQPDHTTRHYLQRRAGRYFRRRAFIRKLESLFKFRRDA